MVVSFTSDWRFSPERSKEISDALLEANKNVSYLEIESTHGHDSFLFSEDRYVRAIKAFLGSGQ
jgi:homoserine O-acetyltransferase